MQRALPEERRMSFRIGVNLGDVIEEDGRIYGDGVNIAARVESLANPGGICVSGKVHDEVLRKLNLAFEDLGEHALKNIAGAVRVFRVRSGSGAGRRRHPVCTPRAGEAVDLRPSVRQHERRCGAGILRRRPHRGHHHRAFALPRAFRHLAQQLIQVPGKPLEVQTVAREMSVHYVVEGSVRKAGNRVRITVQLIDAETDRHLWAERYDRELADIFAVQDEVTAAIVSVVAGRVEAASHERASRKPTENMAAYECVATAKTLHHRSTREANARAMELIERAIALDPKYAHATPGRPASSASSSPTAGARPSPACVSSRKKR